ncbi:YciI family protein [Pseudoxanthomonas dokdonensis]|uniref:YCII-related domain-containing protein n=1 Tax=Pseudoxanthomonas dokdonensis TaxID=344882 RepID=A0A0R0CP69_9GAMM|nr:YciI family protein [Pseudoxanthomonas dokdonensis]KRG71679.1 hypothetical protein ABB29_02725 [Pseudoxanthomonas dokdonensis]
MQFLLLVYTDESLLQTLPATEYDCLMRGCLEHADELREQGTLLQSQQLQPASRARAVRQRQGSTRVTDGPFAETKEMLAGFNLIEAEDMDQAVAIAQQFPWSRFGCIEVRPVHDMDAERRRVGARAAVSAAAVARAVNA